MTWSQLLLLAWLRRRRCCCCLGDWLGVCSEESAWLAPLLLLPLRTFASTAWSPKPVSTWAAAEIFVLPPPPPPPLPHARLSLWYLFVVVDMVREWTFVWLRV